MHAPILQMITQTMHTNISSRFRLQSQFDRLSRGIPTKTKPEKQENTLNECKKKSSPTYEKIARNEKKNKRLGKRARWNGPTSKQGKERKQ